MKVGDLVRRAPLFWKEVQLTKYEILQTGIIVRIEGIYYVVMWSDGLDWRISESIEVISESG